MLEALSSIFVAFLACSKHFKFSIGLKVIVHIHKVMFLSYFIITVFVTFVFLPYIFEPCCEKTCFH